MTDALLLDFNGVVVDDEPLHLASFGAVLLEEGIALGDRDYYANYLGLDDRSAFNQALRRAGRPVSPGTVQELIGRKARAYAALARHDLKVVPGVREFVRAAAAHARVGVVSGALRGEIDAGLKHAGIADVVDTVVNPDDVPTTKPDPAGFQLALRRLADRHGNGAWRAVVIEDSLPGLAAARAFGAGCLMLTTSHDAGELTAADAVWNSFAQHDPDELDPLWRTVAVS